MKQSALLEKEVCGFVYSDRYVSLTSQRSSRTTFVADPGCICRPLARFGEPDAIFHSHPNGILRPSVEDLLQWYYPRSVLIIGTIVDGQIKYKAFLNVSEAKSE